MSGIVSFTLGIVEYTRKQKTEATIFSIVAALFLIVAFDQAWQDEHRNSQILISEKSLAISEREFWKEQAYEKDGSLRSRDQLLAQNYSALIGEQGAANSAQSSLAQLSGKILDITKPEPLTIRTVTFAMENGGAGVTSTRSVYATEIIGLTNKPVQPIDVVFHCSQDFTPVSVPSIAESFNDQQTITVGNVSQMIDSKSLRFQSSAPAWTPERPVGLLVISRVGPIRCDVKRE